MTPAVKISGLKKNYNGTPALKGVDLEIPQGEFFGLLGPNGAGKTTLINCIVGLVKPSGGSVGVFGHSLRKDPLAAKQTIGFSPQEVNVERFFNLKKTLEFQGGFYGLSKDQAKQRAEELLQQFGLSSKAHQQFYKLSGGMQKRLLISRALMSNPKLLILDEPTAGVDVEQRHELWDYLRGLNRDGTTIILTTHYIDEAEALCERVGIINHGHVMELGSPQALIAKYSQTQICLSISESLDPEEFGHLPDMEINGNRVLANPPQVGPFLEKFLPILLKKPGRKIVDLQVNRGNLEEVFLKVTGKPFVEEAEGESAHGKSLVEEVG